MNSPSGLAATERAAAARADVDVTVERLKALGEPTRLRIMLVLSEAELMVADLCRVIDQSQPRVSRHLRILDDAGLLERFAEGTRALYRPTSDPDARRIVDQILESIDTDDPRHVRDLERLSFIRAERAAEAMAFFEDLAEEWDEIRGRHVDDADVEAALLRAIDGRSTGTLLDVGTGTGRILEVFAPTVDTALGLDISPRMLRAARSRLDDLGLDNCRVRHGSVYDLGSMEVAHDVVVLHHVLHFLDEPGRAIDAATRALSPGGTLLVVDFGPHDLTELRTRHGHRHQGFTDDQIRAWCREAGLDDVAVEHLTPAGSSGVDDPLVTSIWVAKHTDP